jgi:hypothetical protein
MMVFIVLMLWLLLFSVSWPLAVIALLIWPVIWLVSLPFRILGMLFSGILAVIKMIFFLPARLLGWKPRSSRFV